MSRREQYSTRGGVDEQPTRGGLVRDYLTERTECPLLELLPIGDALADVVEVLEHEPAHVGLLSLVK